MGTGIHASVSRADRRFYKDMNPNGLEKKSNFELLE